MRKNSFISLKKTCTILFLLLNLIIKAQPFFADSVFIIKTDADCNALYLGSATGNATAKIILPTHPPYIFNWSNGHTSSSGSTSTTNNLGVNSYSLTITNALGADTTLYFSINERICHLTPDFIFTPNGDGINDTWGIANANYYPEALVLIYNRLGQKVYEHKGRYEEPWEGRDLFGIPLPDAAYFYVILEDKSDTKDVIKGTVTILR